MDKPQKPKKTVEGYIAGLAPNAAEALQQVRALMARLAPDLVERISYDIVRFEFSGTSLYVGAWTHHLGVYPIYPGDPDLEPELAPYRSGKDTLKFKYNAPVPLELLAKIVNVRIARQQA